MPEIAEVARVVHFLRLHLVGKRISNAQAPDDPIIFGKVGTTGAAFEAATKGKKVVSAGSQGKYFWITFDRPPHVVMHLGMTGWVHIRNHQTAYRNYYKNQKNSDPDAWPPRFWKFSLETDGVDKTEVAFTDPRRLGRVRLIDCPGKDIRKHSPLVENGPDPVVDVDRFTEDYFRKKMLARRVPVKALLLDQKVLSGVGNWVADEVLFQAHVHPEQYCNEFADEQIVRLHAAIRTVCQTAVDLLGESDEFPKNWLFTHRWSKGKGKSAGALPSGEKLAFITVGGRTSCFAPALQKNTGSTVPGGQVKLMDDEASPEKGKSKKRQRKDLKHEDDENEEVPSPKLKKVASQKSKKESDTKPPAPKTTKRQKVDIKKEEGGGETTKTKRGRSAFFEEENASKSTKSRIVKKESTTDEPGRRRSGRIRSAAS